MKVAPSRACTLLDPPACSRCRLLAIWPQLRPRSDPSRDLLWRRHQSSWAAAAASLAPGAAAQDVPESASTKASRSPDMRIEPLQLIGNEMKYLKNNIRQLLGTGHPMLDTVAKYYNQAEGKHFRPVVVLLMSRATALSPKRPRDASSAPSGPAWSIDRSISPLSVLSDFNPSRPTSPVEDPSPAGSPDILPSQRRLAEIIELIHTASLLHDDIIDQSGMRRSMPSANVAFGNKMAVLAGDFLLGRASAALARLRHAEVTELIATVVANLVEGEFMQLKNTALDGVGRGDGGVTEPAGHPPVSASEWAEDALEFYLQKTYLKSASLISKSCRASALLGQCTPDVVDAAYAYGKNLGMAFQLVDDMLDYTVTADELGKPAGADLELGLVTAPLLFAWKDHDELGSLVQRRFQGEGDIDRARALVLESSGVQQTRALAQEYADKAIDAIREFPDGEAKTGLVDLCVKTMDRRK